MSFLKTDAIILRSFELGEADRVYTTFTRKQGKMKVVAKGVRRTKSRLAGCMQLFSHNQLLIYQGRSLARINQCEIIESFSDLREDLTKMAYASYIAELVEEFNPQEDPNEGLFTLLLSSLVFLKKDWDPEVVIRNFEIRALTLLGYRPELNICVNCGSKIGKEDFLGFSPAKGGVLCSDCKKEGMSLKAGSLLFLRKFLESNSRQLKHLRLPGYAGQELEEVMNKYLEYYLEKPLKSRDFIHTIRNLNLKGR